MAEYDVVLENVNKFFGGFCAVQNFNLNIERGEYITFLGPSGCGKTTTLRMIAGHEVASSGDIYIGGKLVNDIPPGDRDTSLMFQSFALFPHMSVWKNVAFGLEMRKLPGDKIRKLVNEALDSVGMLDLGQRKPSDLSGGQQQRVALARALVTKPAVVLLDEPLGSLDELLRIKIRGELKLVQRKLGVSFIHVTHNQDECLTMGDRMVVMNDGLIEQIGAPKEVFTKPETFFVASFVGDNLIMEGKIKAAEGQNITLETSMGDFKIISDRELPRPEQRTGFSIRADLLTVRSNGDETFENKLSGTVDFVEYVGYIVKLRVALDQGMEAIVKETQDVYFDHPYREGDRVTLTWRAQDAVLLTAPVNTCRTDGGN